MTGPKTFPPETKIGLTTTIPVEVLLAARLAPVDLNNIFITAPDALQLVSEAEAAGLPRTICAGVKAFTPPCSAVRTLAQCSWPARVIAPIPKPWAKSWRPKAGT